MGGGLFESVFTKNVSLAWTLSETMYYAIILWLMVVNFFSSINRELKHATFLNHGQQLEVCCFPI